MKTKQRYAAAIASALWLCMVPIGGKAATNLIVNGGFESPRVPLSGFDSYYAPSNFGGWTVWTGVVDLVGTNYFGSASGLQSLDLNGDVIGAVDQDVATFAGESYRLRFAFAANPVTAGCVGPPVRRMEVRWGSNLLATLEHDVTGHSQTQVGWREFSFIVTATGQDRVSFLSLTPGCAGAAIDDVSLTPATNSINVVDGITIERAVQVCWPTTSGRTYQVQWALRADTSVWTYLGQSIRGDGATNCICDPLGENPKRFYRILETE
jgi:choice-of-anchor C domain-containing protein